MVTFKIKKWKTQDDNHEQINARPVKKYSKYQTHSSFSNSSTLITTINTQYQKQNMEQESSFSGESTQEWLKELECQIIENISKINFTIDDLAGFMNISKRQLYRLINERIGETPHQYLKNYRLNYAKSLLEGRQVNSVKAAAYSTGFPNVVYFSRQFKATFGYLPSDLL